MKNSKIFWRTVYLSGIIFACIFMFIAGISISYENIQRSFYAEFTKAVEITEDGFRILDFEFNNKTHETNSTQHSSNMPAKQ